MKRIGQHRPPRLTADRTMRAALSRAYRYAFAKNTPCWVLVRGRGRNRRYLAHPLPHPRGPNWLIIAMVVAT